MRFEVDQHYFTAVRGNI